MKENNNMTTKETMNGITTYLFKTLVCKRCKHEWYGSKKTKPIQCPKCHSPAWDKERLKKHDNKNK